MDSKHKPESLFKTVFEGEKVKQAKRLSVCNFMFCISDVECNYSAVFLAQKFYLAQIKYVSILSAFLFVDRSFMCIS